MKYFLPFFFLWIYSDRQNNMLEDSEPFQVGCEMSESIVCIYELVCGFPIECDGCGPEAAIPSNQVALNSVWEYYMPCGGSNYTLTSSNSNAIMVRNKTTGSAWSNTTSGITGEVFQIGDFAAGTSVLSLSRTGPFCTCATGDYTVEVLSSGGCVSPTSLPIELISFNGKIENADIYFHWQTATETQNSHFQIQHSTNGKEWSNIGKVEGAGTTTESQEYTFTHRTPSPGVNYYRLKQVDFDGSFSFSKTISIFFGNEKGNMPLSIFPNPIKDEIYLENKTEDILHVELFDMSGKHLYHIEINGSEKTNIPVGDLESGVYFLKINNGQQVYVERVVKK